MVYIATKDKLWFDFLAILTDFSACFSILRKLQVYYIIINLCDYMIIPNFNNIGINIRRMSIRSM